MAVLGGGPNGILEEGMDALQPGEILRVGEVGATASEDVPGYLEQELLVAQASSRGPLGVNVTAGSECCFFSLCFATP